MQYNGKYLNPYDVLGLPWASDVELVKATYKSLVKIYHPDIFKGDKDFAKERLAQLNSAYEFLSDKQQKREFDKNQQSKNNENEQQDFDPEKNSSEFDEGINVLKENWDFACEYYPELKKLYSDLRKMSREPAFAFMAFVVETKEYALAQSIAETLEDAFLTTKFSGDNQIKQIAKRALLEREIKFAQELNKALKILGPKSKDKILMKLSEDFPDFTLQAYRAFKCDNLLSENHPYKVRARRTEREVQRERSSNPWKVKPDIASNQNEEYDLNRFWKVAEYSFYALFLFLFPLLIIGLIFGK